MVFNIDIDKNGKSFFNEINIEGTLITIQNFVKSKIIVTKINDFVSAEVQQNDCGE